MSNWLSRQWQDIKGNVKFYLLAKVALGTSVMSAATWLTHGLSVWQQVSLVALFAVVCGWALIATGQAIRPKSDVVIITPDNVESYLTQWLLNFNVRMQKLRGSEKLHFDFKVNFTDVAHVHIFHPKERNQYLGIMAHFTLPMRYKELFDKLSESEKKRFLIGMRAEIHRARIKPFYKSLFEKVTIEKLLPIKTLTEADLIEQMNDVHASQSLVIDTISLSLGFDEKEGQSAVQAEESSKHEL